MGFDMQDLFAKITVIIHVKSFCSSVSKPTVYMQIAKYNRVSVLTFDPHLQPQAAKVAERRASLRCIEEYTRPYALSDAAMPNGRGKLHGGKSTGPRTPEGLERSRRANWKHAHYSREAKAERSRLRAAILA